MIEATGLTKRYGETLAVDDLSFTVPAGHVTGFLGPNGAGKSTTMRLILGLDSATSGSVTVNGRPYIAMAALYDCRVEALFFDVPLDVCKARNRARKRVVPDEAMDLLASRLQPPSVMEGFHAVRLATTATPFLIGITENKTAFKFFFHKIHFCTE